MYLFNHDNNVLDKVWARIKYSQLHTTNITERDKNKRKKID